MIEFVPEEAIYAAMHCLLATGDHVVSVYPAYQSLHQVAADLGCVVERWEPQEEDGWRFDPAQLERLVRPETRLIVVNFPHNPTGSLPTQAEFRRVVEIARACGAHLFCDEMYRLLEQDPADRLPSGVEVYEKAVTLFGMSKTFGLAGLRLGWLATHDEELRGKLSTFKDYLTICGSAPSELLALMALRDREAIAQRHVRRIAANLEVLGEFVKAHSDLLRFAPPRAGFRLLPPPAREESATEFAARAVNEAGVMIAPSSVFGYGDHHIRIGLGRADFPQALARLGGHLERA